MGKIVPRASVLRQKVSAPSHSLEIVELRVASKLTGNEIILFQFRTNFETKLDFCQAHADYGSPSVAHLINSFFCQLYFRQLFGFREVLTWLMMGAFEEHSEIIARIELFDR